MKMILHLVCTLLLVDQSLDPQDGQAEGDTELQGGQDDKQSVDASQNHLVGRKNSYYCNSCVNLEGVKNVSHWTCNIIQFISEPQNTCDKV